MKILLLIGSLFPIPGNNQNLISKLIPFFRKNNTVHLLAFAREQETDKLPSIIYDVPVHYVTDKDESVVKSIFFRAKAKLCDRNGFSDVITSERVLSCFQKLQKKYAFDAVISISQPYYAAAASASMGNVRKILYLMDPPECLWGSTGSSYRNRSMSDVLQSQDLILTTPFIKEALINKGLSDLENSIETVGFPMIEHHEMKRSVNDNRIRVLFCGWLCSELRAPDYYIQVVNKLDEHFSVIFMGKECEKLCARFPVETRAEIVTLPNQPYTVALQAMQDADILINIGNSVPVHMPSKTLEYINTGKPFVNFYKMKDCPTLYYTKRYPLCLNLFEGDDVEAAAERFEAFCLTEKGKTVDRAWIEAEYRDCTPEYIAGKILEKLGEQ